MVTTFATQAAAYAISIAFLVVGFAHYLGLGHIKAKLSAWGHPSWWPVLAGLAEIGGAVLVAVPQTRMIGLALLLLVVVTALAVRIRAGALKPLAAAFVVAALLGVSIHATLAISA